MRDEETFDLEAYERDARAAYEASLIQPQELPVVLHNNSPRSFAEAETLNARQNRSHRVHRAKVNKPILRVLGTRAKGRAGNHVKRSSAVTVASGGGSDDGPAAPDSDPPASLAPTPSDTLSAVSHRHSRLSLSPISEESVWKH